MPRRWPTQIGPYRIIQRLACGHTAEVFEAEKASGSRRVALKRSLPGARPRQRLRNEYRVLSSVQHPGVVRVHAFEEGEHSESYMVMELLDGAPAAAAVRRLGAPGDPVRCVAVQGIIADVAAAAGALHRAGWVHRDIKSENVMLLSGGQSVLIDPGAACRAGDSGGRGFAGTRAYASPEQLLGKAVSERADVYALGILSYRLLTGRRPFQTDSGHRLLGAKLRQAPPPLRMLPAPIAALIEQTLRPEPDERPTMQMLREGLRPGRSVLSADTESMLRAMERDARPLSSGTIQSKTGLSGVALVAALQEAMSAGRLRWEGAGWRPV